MLRNVKIKPGSFKKSSLKTFGFFLFFSTLIWVLVQLSKEYTQIISFPLAYKNAPMDKSIARTRPVAVEARMQDKGFTLLYYKWFQPDLELDLAQTREEGSQLVYSIDANREEVARQLDLDFEKTTFLVEEIAIDFQARKKKKIRVVPAIKLHYAVGFSAGKSVQLTPDSVEVAGPQSVIDSVEIIKTRKLELNNVNTDVSGSVKLDTAGLGMLSFYRTEVNYTLDVEKFTEGSAKIPVEIVNVPPGERVSVFPQEVTVRYQVNLKRYDMVDASDFRVICDYNDISRGETYLLASVSRKPDFVTNVSLSERRIQFIIKR